MDYQLCIISYFDILGMKQLLRIAGKNADEVANVLLEFRRLNEIEDGIKDEFGWKFVNFSDLAIRAVPIYSEANKQHRIGLLYQEIGDICNLQANLIYRGIIVRGCITMGNIAIEQGLVFGEGLVRAFIQESTKARFPRIIIDPHLFRIFQGARVMRSHDKFGEEWSYIKPYIFTDDDGAMFLNYLNYMRLNETPEKYRKFLERHKEVIDERRKGLKGDKRTKEYKSRRDKIRWLITYHDWWIDRFTEPEHPDDGIHDRNKLMFQPKNEWYPTWISD
jgi:hypothetical protein